MNTDVSISYFINGRCQHIHREILAFFSSKFIADCWVN